MWGVHDRHLLMRRAVRSFFVSDDNWDPRDGPKPASTVLLRNYWEAEMGKDATVKKADLNLEWAVSCLSRGHIPTMERCAGA